MKTIGIVAHSAEGAALCFLTACREGGVQLGPHMHPTIVMSAVPMALSMQGWETENYKDVAKFLSQGVQLVADAGGDFYVCPDNTAHIVLEQIAVGPAVTRAPHRRSGLPGNHKSRVEACRAAGH